MIAALCGYVAFALVYIVTILNPSWPVEVLYAGSIVINLGGTWVVFNMAVYSYLADITPIRTRTKRMGLLDAIWYMGGPIGTVMGVWLYRVYGYIAVFTMSAILWSSCVVYTLVVVKESVVQQKTTQKEKPFKFVLDLGRAAFKRYPNRGRLHLFLLMGIKLGIYLVQGHQVRQCLCSSTTSTHISFKSKGLFVGATCSWMERHPIFKLVWCKWCFTSSWYGCITWTGIKL